MAKKSQTELVLAVLCSIAKQDETLSTREIAELCGCSQRNITMTINRALDKLRNTRLIEFI